MTGRQLCDKLDEFLLEMLEPALQAAFEEHLSTCRECRAELSAQRRVDEALAVLPNEIEVPQGLAEGISTTNDLAKEAAVEGSKEPATGQDQLVARTTDRGRNERGNMGRGWILGWASLAVVATVLLIWHWANPKETQAPGAEGESQAVRRPVDQPRPDDVVKSPAPEMDGKDRESVDAASSQVVVSVSEEHIVRPLPSQQTSVSIYWIYPNSNRLALSKETQEP